MGNCCDRLFFKQDDEADLDNSSFDEISSNNSAKSVRDNKSDEGFMELPSKVEHLIIHRNIDKQIPKTQKILSSFTIYAPYRVETEIEQSVRLQKTLAYEAVQKAKNLQ